MRTGDPVYASQRHTTASFASRAPAAGAPPAHAYVARSTVRRARAAVRAALVVLRRPARSRPRTRRACAGTPRSSTAGRGPAPAAGDAPSATAIAASRCTAAHSAWASLVIPTMCMVSCVSTCTAMTWSSDGARLGRAQPRAQVAAGAELDEGRRARGRRRAPTRRSRARGRRRRTPARGSGSAPAPGRPRSRSPHPRAGARPTPRPPAGPRSTAPARARGRR